MLIHEIPEDTEAVQKAGVGVQGRREAVVDKAEVVLKVNGVQVFGTDKGGEAADAKM